MHTTTSCSGQSSSRRSLETELELAVRSGELHLQSKQLTEFPSLLLKRYVLADTRDVDLSKNKLQEIPVECSQFPNLEKLIMYNNIIRSIPDCVSRLQCLQHLDLSRNQLTYLPAALCQLAQLQSLVVNNNKLVSLPEEIGELTNLMQLDVSCNEIAHLPVQIGDLSNLKHLNLRRNHLQEVSVELTYLQLSFLDLSSNRIVTLPVELRFMLTLVELHLHENPLTCPPANLCGRGRVHIFKYLETIAIKEDKKRGIVADTEQRRSYRKSAQMGDLRLGAISADARLKRHTADSGYGSEQPLLARRWSTEQESSGRQAEDARKLAHRAISYRPAAAPSHLTIFSSTRGFSSEPPSANFSESSTESRSSLPSYPKSRSSLPSPEQQQQQQPAPTGGGPELASPQEANDVTDRSSSSKSRHQRNGESTPKTNSFSPPPTNKMKRDSPPNAPESLNGKHSANNIYNRAQKVRADYEANLSKRYIVASKTDRYKNGLMAAANTSTTAARLPVFSSSQPSISSPRESPSSPTSSTGSLRTVATAPDTDPNSSGLPSRAPPPQPAVKGATTTNTTFHTYRQFKEQQKLAAMQQRDASLPPPPPHSSLTGYHHNTNGLPPAIGGSKLDIVIKPYSERNNGASGPLQQRAGAPPEGSPPSPPTSQYKPYVYKTASGPPRTAIPTSSRSYNNIGMSSVYRGVGGNGSYSREIPIERIQQPAAVPSSTDVAKGGPLPQVQEAYIHHLRAEIEQRLKISLGEDLGNCLTDGVVLCHMVNHVTPRSVNSIHVPSPAVPKLSAAKCRRNVDSFLGACRKIGVREDLICSPSDVMEPNRTNLVRVAITVIELLRFKPN